MGAVIDRAVSDLKGIGPRCRAIETDRAMAFILSGACEAWCLELGIDYETIRGKAAALYGRILEKAGRPENEDLTGKKGMTEPLAGGGKRRKNGEKNGVKFPRCFPARQKDGGEGL
jgi:hypothetical protein